MSQKEREARALTWRKSSYSIGNGQCVEAAADHQVVMIRDTARPVGDQLVFSAAAWEEFTARIRG
jgi:hypothetical protein